MDMNISNIDHYEWEQAKTAVIGEDRVPDTLARQGRYPELWRVFETDSDIVVTGSVPLRVGTEDIDHEQWRLVFLKQDLEKVLTLAPFHYYADGAPGINFLAYLACVHFKRNTFAREQRHQLYDLIVAVYIVWLYKNSPSTLQ